MISKSVDGISVIICCYNSSWVIGRCLDAFKKQIVGEDINWEIVIVDNNCSDNTVEIANASLKNSGLDYSIVKESEPGLLNARKKGVSVIKYPFIIFCDDDNLLSSNYIDLAYHTLKENPRVGAVGGMGVPEFESEPEPDILPSLGNYAVGSQKGNENWLYGAGMAVRTSLVEDIYKNQNCYLVGRKGNKLLAGDDVELSMSIVLRGFQLKACDEISFTHVLKSNRLTKAYLDSMQDGFRFVSPVIFVFQCVLSGKSFMYVVLNYLKLLIFSIKNLIRHKDAPLKSLNAYNYWGVSLYRIYREWSKIKNGVII